MRLPLEVAPLQVSGCLVQCSCPSAMNHGVPMVVSAQRLALRRLDKDSFAGQAFSRLPFQPPHFLGDCLHLTPVVCLGCGTVCNRRLLSAGLSAPVVPGPSPVSQLLAGAGEATPQHLKSERGPFFSFFSSFLPCSP